jgi:hypothetical protein
MSKLTDKLSFEEKKGLRAWMSVIGSISTPKKKAAAKRNIEIRWERVKKLKGGE